MPRNYRLTEEGKKSHDASYKENGLERFRKLKEEGAWPAHLAKMLEGRKNRETKVKELLSRHAESLLVDKENGPA